MEINNCKDCKYKESCPCEHWVKNKCIVVCTNCGDTYIKSSKDTGLCPQCREKWIKSAPATPTRYPPNTGHDYTKPAELEDKQQKRLNVPTS